MALTVNFWTFAKKENSTAQPAGSPARVLSCALKSDSGILSPVLEIGLEMSFNPYALNYCQIPAYDRYYFVTDWQWSEGLWLCSLAVDPLASYKTEIGGSSHYVLRSSYAHNINAIDEFYPALGWRPNFYYDSASFSFSQNLNAGVYIVGIAASGTGGNAVTYYALSAQEIGALVEYMLNPVSGTSDTWLDTFTGLTDTLYRAVYSPFDYIKSCKWFPVGDILTQGQYNTILRFGTYRAVDSSGQAACTGHFLGDNSTNWPYFTQTLDLPTGWLSLEAKYKTAPYARLYILFNPFGVIEINPLDLTDSVQLELRLYPDYISGDALLKIYKKVGSALYFITERTTRLSLDIQLSAASIDLAGLLSGSAGAAGGLAAALTAGSGAGVAAGLIAAAGGVASAGAAATPTMSNAIGSNYGGPRAMEGNATLFYISTYFADEDNADFGKPLLETRQLSTIPGFIKCADGHIQIAGFEEEIRTINEHLTGGFFYE